MEPKKTSESRAAKALNLCEDAKEKVGGVASTMGKDCPICAGKKLLDCPFCEEGKCEYGICTLCSGTGSIKCTMCHPERGLPG